MKFASFHPWAASALLACACAAHAAPDTGQLSDEELYLKALQSIAEGRRADATTELSELIQRTPQHAGAWLELALTHCALGNSDEAERLFAHIETRFAPSAAIRELIANTREQGCSRWDAFQRASVTLARGYDQNVNQGALTNRYTIDAPGGQVEYELTDDFLPRPDHYVQLGGDYLREVTPNGAVAFAQYQLRHNDTLEQYNSGSLFTGLEAPYRIGAWRLRASGTLGLVSLGGQLYQRQAQLQARVTLPSKLPLGSQFSVVGTLTRNSFPTLTNFDSRVQELRGHLSLGRGSGYASATLGYQHDQALAQRPGGNRRGLFGNVLLRRQFRPDVMGELGYAYQHWNSSQVYAAGLIDVKRSQSTQVLRSSVTYAVSRRQALVAEARWVRNRENISIFQYNNRVLQLSWQWQLP